MSSRSPSVGSASGSLAISLLLIILSVFVAVSARAVLSPLQELIKVDLGASDNEIALLQGLAIALPLAFLSLPIGRLIDRINRSRLLFALSLLCTVGSVITAFAHSFVLMFAARMVVGLATTGMTMTALSIVADLSRSGSRGRLVMVIGLTQIVGGAVSFMLAGPLLEWLPTALSGFAEGTQIAPWRLVQFVFAAVTGAFSFVLLLMREPPRHELGTAAGGELRAAVRELWSYRRVLIPVVVGATTINMADAAADIWAVPVLTRSFNLQPADFGTWMGLVVLCSGIFGGALGGVLGDYCQRFIGRPGVLMAALAGAACSMVGAFYPLAPSVVAFGALFAIFQAAGACSGIASAAGVALLIPNELRGVCISIMAAVSVLMSYGVAPLLVSLATSALHLGSQIGIPLTVVSVTTSLLGTVAFAIAIREAGKALRVQSSSGFAVDEVSATA